MSLRLSICTLIIGILTNSIDAVPQYSREYLGPVVDSAATSNWYTTNRETGTIPSKPSKDSFTFIDSSEVHDIKSDRRPSQHNRVSFRNEDTSNENTSRSESINTDDGTVILPLPNRTSARVLHTRSGDSKISISVLRDHNGELKFAYPTRHPNHNYDVFTPLIRAPLLNDNNDEEVTTQLRESDIVFPNDTGTDFYEPANSDIVPKCKSDEILCTEVDNYPEHLIENIVKEEAYRFRDFFGADKLMNPNVTSRLGTPTDSYLCESAEDLIFPKTGLTSQDKWKYIVNTANFTQGIRIEKCLRQKSRCNFANVFPNGYEPVCEQKFIMRQLVSVTDRGKTATDQFKIPSCCNCVLKVRPKLKLDEN